MGNLSLFVDLEKRGEGRNSDRREEEKIQKSRILLGSCRAKLKGDVKAEDGENRLVRKEKKRREIEVRKTKREENKV